MTLIYLVVFFIAGLLFGRIANRIGKYLPVNEYILKKEKCAKCGANLPNNIITYFINSGRCSKCNNRLAFFPIYNELFTALLFSLAYYIFGLSSQLMIALGVILLLVIIIVSDLNYLIIPDEVLVLFSLYFIAIQFYSLGFAGMAKSIVSGFFLFMVMYSVMLIGNFIFKTESIGGGDIKMMFIFGLILGPFMGLFSIFVASIIALPFSLIVMHSNKKSLIPFGPFLMLSLLMIYFMQIDANFLFDLVKF